MAIWGVGAKFGGRDSKMNSFIEESFWCTGFIEQEKPKVYEMIKEIQIDDVVFMKSLPLKSSTMNIWAIGIVTDIFKNTNSHIGFEDCYNEIGVKWIISNLNQPLLTVEVHDKQINERKTTIFREYNIDIVEKIIKLLLN